MKGQVTVLAFSHNEAKRIRFFLESMRGFAPLVLIDNFSSDDTVAIASAYTDRIYQHKNAGYVEDPETVRYALAKADTVWVYWGRIDEIPPRPLLEALQRIVEEDAADVVLISRLNLFFGVPTHSWGQDHQIILFKKSCLEPDQSAVLEHGRIKSGSRVVTLPARKDLSLWHFSSYDSATLASTLNRYSSIAAESKRTVAQRDGRGVVDSNSPDWVKKAVKDLVGRSRRSSRLVGLRLVLTPVLGFLWHYLYRGGFRSGQVGLVTSLSMGVYHLLLEMKIWEQKRGVSLERLNGYYDELKSQLVAGTIPDARRSPFDDKGRRWPGRALKR